MITEEEVDDEEVAPPSPQFLWTGMGTPGLGVREVFEEESELSETPSEAGPKPCMGLFKGVFDLTTKLETVFGAMLV